MIIGIISGPNPVEEIGHKDADPPEKCGYGVQDTVEWPATDPSTIKGRFFTDKYPADPYLEDDRKDESYEHEKGESADEEKEERL